jgi:phage protein D
MSPAVLDSTPVYAGNDFYVPYFEVSVGGRKQSGAVVRDVMQVSYKDNVEQIDGFELTVNNWDADQRKFKYSDKPLFEPGQRVELKMGYMGSGGSGLRMMIRGEITALRPTFPASGQPTLAVSGLNVLHKFQDEQKSDKYDGMTLGKIAEKVCDRLKSKFPVKFDGPQAPVLEAVQTDLIQNNEYDIVFLIALARRAGYELVADDSGDVTSLSFGQPSSAATVSYKLQYGRTLTEFQPNLDFSHQVSEVEVRGWDPVKGEAIQVTADQGQAGPDGLQGKMKQGTANPVAARREVINNAPVRDAQAAREVAAAQLRRINNVVVTATGSVVGLPDLRAGAQIQVDGLGLRFNGRYFVTATTHTIGNSGYVTQFECRLVALSNKSDGEALS